MQIWFVIHINKQIDNNQNVCDTQTDEMSEFSCKQVETAFNDATSEKIMANAIRKAFNETHGPVWNVIVGRHFGSDVCPKKYFFFPLY